MKKIIVLFLIFALEVPAFSQWQDCSNGIEGKDLNQAFIFNSEIWVGAVGSGLYKSTNGGVSWLLSYSNSYYPSKFVSNLGNIFYLSSNAGTRVYRTVNSGLNWEYVSSSTSGEKWDIMAYNNELYLASYGIGVYKSDIGVSWTLFNNQLNSLNVQSLGSKDNYVFVGTRANGIARSSNQGQSWEPANSGLNILDILGFCTLNNGIMAFTDDDGNGAGVYFSSNFGQNWIFKGLPDKDIQSLVYINNAVFALVYNEGVYVSLNNGDSWALANSGLTNLRAKHIVKLNDYLYYFAYSNTGTDKPVWKRPVSEVIGISPVSSAVPEKFHLSQNYPNPFNPVTNIEFDLPKESFVKLIVYDALGKEVAVLVNQYLGAGSYKADWNASDYPSGIYFYKLEAGEFVETKKMILIK